MTIRTIQLLDPIALTVDLPQYNLWRGQVGTVVEILANGAAFEVEKARSHGSHLWIDWVASWANHGLAFWTSFSESSSRNGCRLNPIAFWGTEKPSNFSVFFVDQPKLSSKPGPAGLIPGIPGGGSPPIFYPPIFYFLFPLSSPLCPSVSLW